MSKAEDLSREYVLPFLDKHYEKYGEHKQMELSRFDGYDMMSAYEEGYHQAEKDLELSREDIETIQEMANKYCKHHSCEPRFFVYSEILKRFKTKKEK